MKILPAMKTMGLCGLVAAAFLLFASSAQAAGDMPHIGYVYPAGGQLGTSFEVKVGGEKVYGCQSASITGDGIKVDVIDAQEPSDPKKRKPKKDKSVIDEIITLKVTISADAEPGDHELRLATPKGLSNKLTFQVGQLKEISEAEPNNARAKATSIADLPTALNGQITPGGDVDIFKFHARKGQHIVIQADVRTLVPYIADAVPGWFQADLALFDSSGAELAHSSDFKFNQDPVLFYIAELDTDLFLAVRDSIYRGREDFVYRVKIGELPFITAISPLGARQGKDPVKVKLSGINLPSSSIKVNVDKEAPSVQFIQVKQDGLLSNKLPFAIGTLPELSKGSGNGSMEDAQRLELPVLVNGAINPDEKNFFSFEGKKGEKVACEVFARRLGSPLDSSLELFNAKGERIAQNDDFKDPSEGMLTHHADSQITMALPEDGVYFLKLCDIQGKGGPDFAYRLRLSQPEPDFELRADPASISLSRGGSALVTFNAMRKNGFKGEINLTLKGDSPAIFLSGGLVPSGADKAYATLTAAESAPLGTYAAEIEGSAQINGKTVLRKAIAAEDLMQAFIYHHFVPSVEQTALILDKAKFSLSAKLAEGKTLFELPAGKEIYFNVYSERQEGYDEAIRLQLLNPPKGIVLLKGVIPPGQNSCVATIKADAKMPAGTKGNIIVYGTMTLDRPDPAQPAPQPAKLSESQKPDSAGGNQKGSTEIKLSESQKPDSASKNSAPAGVVDSKDTKAQPEKKVRKERINAGVPAIPFITTAEIKDKAKNDTKNEKK